MSSSSSSSITYPSGAAVAKHDLVCPQAMPREGLLLDCEFGFQTTSQLFSALEKPPPPLKQLAICTTYKDAPPAMSKALLIIGFADTSLKLVRQLLFTGDNVPSCLTQCIIAVMRGDAGHKLERYHVTNSPKFAKFMRRMQEEGIVAILAPDKQGRFGILAPAAPSGSTSYTKNDFCAALYLGTIPQVKEYLLTGGGAAEAEPAFVPTTPPMEFVPTTPPMDEPMDDAPVWKPPDDDNDNDGPTYKPPDEDDAPSWKPPEDDDAPAWKPPEEEDSGGLWKPPGEDSGGFGDSNSGGGMWEPPATESESNGFGENAWNPSSSSGTKRSHSEMDNNEDDDDDKGDGFHADSGAAAADKFYSGLTRSLDTRDQSRIFHMRAFNGWVKATQIQELNPRTKGNIGGGMRVLDLACGKGGDLGKWVHHKRGIQNYVGVDVARGSLKDAAIRARKMRKKLKNRCTFTCADLGHDVPGRLRSAKHAMMQKLLTWNLQGESEYETEDPVFTNARGGGISVEDRFDVISVQFAIHYMMQTRQRARRFFQTCSELLEVGGNLICTTIDARIVVQNLMDQGLNLHFDYTDEEDKLTEATVVVGNGACKLTFDGDTVQRLFTAMQKPIKFDDAKLFGLEYSFTLVEGSDHGAGVGDAVNLPEWLNPIPVLEALANDAGLELVSAENFHEFFENRKDPSSFSTAHEALYNMKVLDRNGSIKPDNWEISRMYCAIKFRKVKESKMVLDEDDVPVEEEEDEPEETKPALDPIKAKKMLPMAMMKAKKNLGADKWQELSSEEKKRLTQIELENLVNPEW